MNLACAQLFFVATLWTAVEAAVRFQLDEVSLEAALRNSSDTSASRARRKRFISEEMTTLLEFHNRVRSEVSPPAANMEYMVWDEALATSAESWASQCLWAHGPPEVLKSNGQNLSLLSGSYTSIIDLVTSWYNERNSFSFPNTCKVSTCGHYTQMVWAVGNKIGCAVRSCSNMDVSGKTWSRATLLVCNYITGNWVGGAPYKTGKPCSACPSSYGGSCNNNLCYS